jgi:CheY-like chemotaxis protein
VTQQPARRTALLVEDETLIAMLAEDSLGAMGFDAICVTTAAEALSALSSTEDLAVAVVDIGLPDMRGDQLAGYMRELLPALPIVVASGYDSTMLAQQFSTDMAIKVLGKPYTDKDLKEALSSLGLMVG